MGQSARHLAYNILVDIQFNGAYANLALDKALLRSDLNTKDRRLVTELVNGCTKMQLHLDHCIKTYCDFKRVDKKTLLLLRMAVYQQVFMDKIPKHAILNETVELSKQLGLHSDKFINGVLRSMTREERPVKWPDKRKQRNQFISKWYSFPQWIIDSWVKENGFENTEKLCEYYNRPAKTWIRVNTLKATPGEIKRHFDNLGVPYTQHAALPEAFCLSSLQKIRENDVFRNGQIIVQDLSAMLPALILNPSKNARVLDMCAAPGGKTTYLSAIMENGGEILACELHPHRKKLIEQNVRRLGVENVQYCVGDARTLPSEYVQAFDAILLDAPCSGLGVLNRRADLRWKIRRGNLQEIENLQAQLLDAAATYLKIGGTLVYSTCTLNRGENDAQVQGFIERHPNFSLVPFDCLAETCHTGFKTIYPYIDHSDGFFMAKFERKE